MGKMMLAGLPKEADMQVLGGCSVRIDGETDRLLAQADVVVDFTHIDTAPELIVRAIEAGVRPVSGTSGMSEQILAGIDEAARRKGIAAVWAPSMSTGGALLMHFAKVAARYYDSVEIVDAAHATKADSPSGTALVLTDLMREAHGSDMTDWPVGTTTLEGVRGGVRGGVRVHSVRSPGVFARTEVLFSSNQAMLTIGYQEIGRDEFATSAAIAIRRVMEPGRVGLIRGFDGVLGL
jgi:4-hydroxy-tetrahydrodipicolinate reductase